MNAGNNLALVTAVPLRRNRCPNKVTVHSFPVGCATSQVVALSHVNPASAVWHPFCFYTWHDQP
jgi:hypothetical protein